MESLPGKDYHGGGGRRGRGRGGGRGGGRAGGMDDGSGMMNRDMGGRGGYSGRGGYRGGGGSGGPVMRGGHSGAGGGSAGPDAGGHAAGDHSPHHGHGGHQPGGGGSGGPHLAFNKPAPEFEMKGNDFPALPGLDEPRKVSTESNDSGSKRG